jgi:hypothetical protein
MADQSWVEVVKVFGELQAEMLRGLFEAQGIPVMLNQEGAGRAYGINVGRLGEVQILVPSDYVAEAQSVLADYEAGVFEEEGQADEDEGEEGETDPDPPQ